MVTVRAMPPDLTVDQWDLLKSVFNTPGKRGRKHAEDLRTVVDALLSIGLDGLPVALPARVLRALHSGLVAVSAAGRTAGPGRRP